MFILDIHKLKKGDVFLTAQLGLVSKAVRNFTNSEYSHAILYVGHGSYIHSDSQGVHSANIQRLIFKKPSSVKILRPNDQKCIKNAVMYSRSQVGKAYSVRDAIRTKTGNQSKPENKQFCSRLVAESFEYAGVPIVKNSLYCTPEDINRSPIFTEINGMVRETSKEELDFASGPNPIQRQTEITNFILSEARRITNKDIQSMEELSLFVVANPKYSDAIVKVYRDTDYLTMWEYEVSQNPWRYDERIFMILPVGREEKRRMAEFEAESAKDQLMLYSNNYTAYQNLSMHGMSSYIAMNMDLYKKLINQMNKRLDVANYVLSNI
jgi:hypothetical protein